MLRVFADGRLFGDKTGAGVPWVLALHGWQRTHADFGAVLSPPDGGPVLDAYAPDLPGFGASPAPPAGWASGAYAEVVGELLGEMAPHVVVVGHSFGGRVALRLAARFPDRVAALVLTGAPVAPRPAGTKAPRPARAFRVGRALHRAGLVRDTRMEALRHKYGSTDYRQAQGILRQVLVANLAEDYSADLKRITCPVELLWGREDTEAPLAGAGVLATLMPSARLTILDGVGHLVPVEAPADLRAVVERHRPGASGAAAGAST